MQFSLKDVNDAIKGYKNDLDNGPLNPKNFASNKDGEAEGKDDYFVYNETYGCSVVRCRWKRTGSCR